MKSRLTVEENNLIEKAIFENDISKELSSYTLSDIYYLSCKTNISYHKIFGQFMAEYMNDEYLEKRRGIYDDKRRKKNNM